MAFKDLNNVGPNYFSSLTLFGLLMTNLSQSTDLSNTRSGLYSYCLLTDLIPLPNFLGKTNQLSSKVFLLGNISKLRKLLLLFPKQKMIELKFLYVLTSH